LGLREDTSVADFQADAYAARNQGKQFDIATHVNALPSEAHDLFLIPSGTVHCSGADNLVLEISATPYIYTFKIYDYLRRDLSGQPRPISYQRAFEVIDFTRKTDWVGKNLIAKPRLIDQDEGWRRYMLSDLALEFHNVERIEF